MVRHLYLLGSSVKHTLGPVIMQAACDSLGLEVRSEEWPLEDPAGLPERVRRMRDEEVLGTVVTIPYKVAIIPLLDTLDEDSQRMGAVNTVYKAGGRLAGCNTDVIGFMTSLTREGGFDPKNKRATILGAGGAARACGFALARAGIRSIAFVDPTHAGFEDLLATLKTFGVEIRTIRCGEDCIEETVGGSDLVINCSPVGTKYGPQEGENPLAPNLIRKGQMVYDVIYKPLETPFLKMAREAGAMTLNGLTWAVYTCAAAVRLFTSGGEPSVDAMRRAALDMAQEQEW
ncbi:MAG: shikimate dehydrogenase [Deltaproteobacteria bacterium]|nr:shikimate dehydrogenase [Deltaproteobacteria bacterium]